MLGARRRFDVGACGPALRPSWGNVRALSAHLVNNVHSACRLLLTLTAHPYNSRLFPALQPRSLGPIRQYVEFHFARPASRNVERGRRSNTL